jgi:hypothetical protein
MPRVALDQVVDDLEHQTCRAWKRDKKQFINISRTAFIFEYIYLNIQSCKTPSCMKLSKATFMHNIMHKSNWCNHSKTAAPCCKFAERLAWGKGHPQLEPHQCHHQTVHNNLNLTTSPGGEISCTVKH